MNSIIGNIPTIETTFIQEISFKLLIDIIGNRFVILTTIDRIAIATGIDDR